MNASIQDMAVPDDSTILLPMSTSGTMYLFRSVDAGANWSVFPGPNRCSQFAFADSWRGAAVGSGPSVVGGTANDILYRTDDGGATWERVIDRRIPEPFGLLNVASADAENAITIGRSGKILRTRDGGRNWEQQAYPENNVGINNVGYIAFPSLSRAYATSSDFRIIGYKEGSSAVQEILPADQSCHVRPNPVAPGEAITISLSSPDGADAEVRIIDLLGSVIGRRSIRPRRGNPEILSIDAPDAAGIYFVHISSASRMLARVPVIVR